MNTQCVFCRLSGETRIAETEFFCAILDKYPVNLGHALIISKRHVPDLFSLTSAEFNDLGGAIKLVKKSLDQQHSPNGYNIGVNCGEAAGQTVPHFHLHVIPRYKSDVENPRGGVRNIKKPLRSY